MADLGSFAAAAAEAAETADDTPQPDTFTFGDVTGLRVRRPLPGFLLMEYQAAVGSKPTPAVVFSAIFKFLEGVLVAEDWPKFRDESIRTGAGLNEFVNLANAVITGAAGRPTGSPSDSANGQRTDGTASKGEPSETPPQQDTRTQLQPV